MITVWDSTAKKGKAARRKWTDCSWRRGRKQAQWVVQPRRLDSSAACRCGRDRVSVCLCPGESDPVKAQTATVSCSLDTHTFKKVHTWLVQRAFLCCRPPEPVGPWRDCWDLWRDTAPAAAAWQPNGHYLCLRKRKKMREPVKDSES